MLRPRLVVLIQENKSLFQCPFRISKFLVAASREACFSTVIVMCARAFLAFH
jgi:hypothetical protein